MPLAQLTGFLGANLKAHERFLPDGVGVMSLNQKPSEEGDLRPWRIPLAIGGIVANAGWKTIYRMGRDVATAGAYWLGWTTVVHAIRAFDASDPTERTAFTGSGSPKWTDNIQALASTPYPTAARELAVPQPTVAPGVTLNTDASTGTARQLYYVYTRVNDIGWESAPSPPVLAPLAKPGATLNLTISESVPAGNYGVNRVRWYRTQVVAGTADAEYLFLREYAIGASGMLDDARELGEKLATETWLSLETTATWLTYCWNQFAAALVGKAVRFCEPNEIYAWPLEYEYTLSSTPIALAAFAGRLLALTSDGGELFTGIHPDSMDQKPMAIAPIVAERSLVVGERFAIWAADDGLYYYGAEEGYRCLTSGCMKADQWRALVPSTIVGSYFTMGDRPLYIGFYNDGALKGFVVDPANPLGIYFLSTGYSAAYWDKLLRKLFVLDGSTVKQWDAGASFMTATFKGKVHRQIAYTEGEWFELLGKGTATLKVWTDEVNAPDNALVQRMSRTVATGEGRLPDGTGGRDWQMEVSTATSVQGVVLE